MKAVQAFDQELLGKNLRKFLESSPEEKEMFAADLFPELCPDGKKYLRDFLDGSEIGLFPVHVAADFDNCVWCRVPWHQSLASL